MKTLILQDDIPPEAKGGAGIVAYNLAKAFKDLGQDVYIVSATQNKNNVGQYTQDGLHTYKIYSQYHRRWRAFVSLYNSQTVKKLNKIIADIKPDVVFAHNIHNHLSYYSLKIAKKAGASVFLTAHDLMLFNYGKIKIPKEATAETYLNYCKLSVLDQIKENKKRYNPIRNLVIKTYLKKYTDKVFAVSDSLKKVLALNGISNVEVIHNGIDVETQKIDEGLLTDFKRNNGLENKKVILFGGRISEEKGIEQAVQSFDRILKEIPEALLLMVGDKVKVSRPDLPIKSLGWLSQEEMKLALGASDVVIFPSICFETFGMVVLEAMAQSKPVVGSCFGGASEIIVNGQTGYVVNPYDTKTMADKVVGLLIDSEKNREFGRRGYERARDLFSLRKQAEKYLNLYLCSNR